MKGDIYSFDHLAFRTALADLLDGVALADVSITVSAASVSVLARIRLPATTSDDGQQAAMALVAAPDAAKGSR